MGKAKTQKHKTKETSPQRYKSAKKQENKPGLQSPFLLNRLVHFLAAIWHNLSPPLTGTLRALEGCSAAAYFRAWREIPLHWKGLNQRPIPNSWHRIGSRTSLFKLAGNGNAAHPINAMINYAYAILESQVRIQSVTDGYDPTIGIMHESRDGASAFVFDMMEPERLNVDRSILEFIKSHTFHAADFVIRANGVCRLNPAMARHVAQVVCSAFE